MTKRGRRERLCMQAAVAWHMAEIGVTLAEIAAAMRIPQDRVWELLEFHARRRAKR